MVVVVVVVVATGSGHGSSLHEEQLLSESRRERARTHISDAHMCKSPVAESSDTVPPQVLVFWPSSVARRPAVRVVGSNRTLPQLGPSQAGSHSQAAGCCEHTPLKLQSASVMQLAAGLPVTAGRELPWDQRQLALNSSRLVTHG
jgi:hypothetical protein